MSDGAFTFINTTDASRLSKAAAKRVRGHNTRNVFAARREQKVKTAAKPRARKGVDKGDHVPRQKPAAARKPQDDEPSDGDGVEAPRPEMLPSSQPSEHERSAAPPGEDGASWSNLHISEPVIAEAIMAIAARHYSASVSGPSASSANAEATHSTAPRLNFPRTLSTTMDKFGAEQVCSDAVLETAVTMALEERMLGDEAVWEAHMNSVARILRARRSGADHATPALLSHLLMLDAANFVFGLPRLFHRKVLDQLLLGGSPPGSSNPALAAVAELAVNLRGWRAEAQLHPEWGYVKPPREFEELWMRLFMTAKALQFHGDACVAAAARCADLILRLHEANGSSTSPDLGPVVDGLRAALERSPVTSCPLVDSSSVPLWLGAVASPAGSGGRRWFVGRLRAGVRAAGGWRWPALLPALERELWMAGDEVLLQLRRVSEEVYGASLPEVPSHGQSHHGSS